MRRMRIIVPLCLLLLFVPIYLWKVQGIGDGSSGVRPTNPYNPDDDKPVFNSLDTRDFQRGIVASTDLSEAAIDPFKLYARTDPVELLRLCLLEYQKAGIKGYSCTFAMHERVKGKLKQPEVIEAWFKEEPFSVFMHWKEGAELAAASLYVANEHDGKVCVRPQLAFAKVAGWVKRAPDGAEAKDTSRYRITEFGVRCGTERTYKAWKALRDKGAKLNVEYLGKRKVEDVGGRDCHVIRRYCDPPEEEGLTEITLFIDAETWFQVGSVLMAKDNLIGQYFFRDIVLNPSFDDKQFKPETLKKY